jgi:predicted ATPase
MIRKLVLQNFKMLRECAVSFGPFQLLVGPGASGKSSLLDALLLTSDVVAHGASEAVQARASRLDELCFDPARPIAIAVELLSPKPALPCARYEIELVADPAVATRVRIAREQLFIVARPELLDEPPPVQPTLFGIEPGESSLLHDKTPRGWRKAVAKSAEAKDYFWDEGTDWHNMFRFGPDRCALGSLPEDVDRFPASIAVRDLLRKRLKKLALCNAQLRAPSPPVRCTRLEADGAGLPCAVRELQQRDASLFERWLDRIRFAAPGLLSLQVRERTEDKYLVLEAMFQGRSDPVPSWLLSDETLRVMALTLLAEQSTADSGSVWLIDEPEIGLGPRAIHVAFEALSSDQRGCQVICATSSPMLAARAKRDDVVVLRRSTDGSAVVTRGMEAGEKPSWFEPDNA